MKVRPHFKKAETYSDHFLCLSVCTLLFWNRKSFACEINKLFYSTQIIESDSKEYSISNERISNKCVFYSSNNPKICITTKILSGTVKLNRKFVLNECMGKGNEWNERAEIIRRGRLSYGKCRVAEHDEE